MYAKLKADSWFDIVLRTDSDDVAATAQALIRTVDQSRQPPAARRAFKPLDDFVPTRTRQPQDSPMMTIAAGAAAVVVVFLLSFVHCCASTTGLYIARLMRCEPVDGDLLPSAAVGVGAVRQVGAQPHGVAVERTHTSE
jgi:hypothetical protein